MRKYSPEEEEDGKEWAAERSVACRSNPSWQAAATALSLISMSAADFETGTENDSKCTKLSVGRNNINEIFDFFRLLH